MAVFNNIGDTIEGEAMEVDGRSQRCQGLHKHPVTKKTMLLYATDRNSHAIVTEAGTVPEDPDQQRLTGHYHRQVGDKVTGDALSIYIDSRRPVRFQVLHGPDATHRHGLQYANVRVHAIATVKMILANLQKKLGYSNNQLEKK